MKLHYYYDKEADVLYFSQGKPSVHDDSQETANDVILRFDHKTHKVKGFTVLNFTRRMHKKASVPLPINIELTPA